MASTVFTGIATGHEDLLDKIVTHLTTGLASQNWQVVKSDTSVGNEVHKYLKGPGLSGNDEIFVNIRSFKDVSTDKFNWNIYGAINFNPLNSLTTQPGISPAGTVSLWDSSIPYWLIANGRRFILIAKVSTTYHGCYCGFYLPYATSAEMPYPMCIMTSSYRYDQRWSAGVYTVGGFWDPVDESSYLRHFDGNWIKIVNYQARGDGQRFEVHDCVTWPYEYDYSIGMSQDGSYGILPVILHANYSSGNVYGELEGVFRVAGFSNAAEDILDIGADQYLVVQSVYRTNNRDYAAIKLG